jgi:spermine oxidase
MMVGSKVTLDNGQKFEADHVIFTPSLGVLKENYKTLFTPALPPWKSRAIIASGYGTLEKMFFEFEKPFWPKDKNEWVSYDFLWTQTEKSLLRNTDKEW